MMTQTSNKKTTQEQQLLNIVRRLPGERVAQVIDFAQFLEAQQARTRQELLELSEQVSEGDAKWDALLASDDAQHLLEQMADNASREISAGKAAPMRFMNERSVMAQPCQGLKPWQG